MVTNLVKHVIEALNRNLGDLAPKSDDLTPDLGLVISKLLFLEQLVKHLLAGPIVVAHLNLVARDSVPDNLFDIIIVPLFIDDTILKGHGLIANNSPWLQGIHKVL